MRWTNNVAGLVSPRSNAGLINMQTAENKSLIDQKHISYNMQQDHGGGHPGCCWSVAA